MIFILTSFYGIAWCSEPKHIFTSLAYVYKFKFQAINIKRVAEKIDCRRLSKSKKILYILSVTSSS